MARKNAIPSAVFRGVSVEPHGLNLNDGSVTREYNASVDARVIDLTRFNGTTTIIGVINFTEAGGN